MLSIVFYFVLSIIVVLYFGKYTYQLMVKFPRLKIVVLLLLSTMIVGFASYGFYKTYQPIQLKNETDKRYLLVKKRLVDSKNALLLYHSYFGKYTSDWDTLVDFVKAGKIQLIRTTGKLPDTISENEALKLNLIKKDTLWIAAIDSLKLSELPDSLQFVPFANKAKFNIRLGKYTTTSGIKIDLFEIEDSKPFDPMKVLKIGSIRQPNGFTGNWE